MKIQKFSNTYFQNNTKSNIAKRFLYSAAAATALLVSAPKANAQSFTDQFGQTYVHYSQYQSMQRQREQARQQELNAEARSDASMDELIDSKQELQKLRNEIKRIQKKYQEELDWKNEGFDKRAAFLAETNSYLITSSQEQYIREVNQYNDYVKQHKASPWIGLGIGSLLGFLVAGILNRKSK